MSEWKTALLGDTTEIVLSNIDKKIYPNEISIKLCNYMDVYSNRYLRRIHEFNPGSVTRPEYDRFKLNTGDVIITKDSETADDIAIPAVLIDQIDDLVCGYHLAILKPKKAELDGVFLMNLLQMPSVKLQFGAKANGITRYGMTKDGIHSIRIKYPSSLPEQRKIARILSSVDTVIEKTEATIAKYKAIQQGMMRDLFTRGLDENGHLRPRNEDAPRQYKHTELGWVPNEWKVDKLGNIMKRYGGYLQTGPFGSQLHAHEYQYEGIPVVMPQNINDGLIRTDQIARIHEQRANDLVRHRMNCGDIIIARRGELSRAAAISKVEEGWVCGTGCFLLRLKQSTLNADYTAYVYRQDFIQRQIDANAVGTTMPSLNNTVMAELFFPYCDEAEQKRIVERLTSIDRNIRTYQTFLSKKLLLKQGLMSDLLTGKKRVKTNTVM